jgi:hypothetical protein
VPLVLRRLGKFRSMVSVVYIVFHVYWLLISIVCRVRKIRNAEFKVSGRCVRLALSVGKSGCELT